MNGFLKKTLFALSFAAVLFLPGTVLAYVCSETNVNYSTLADCEANCPLPGECAAGLDHTDGETESNLGADATEAFKTQELENPFDAGELSIPEIVGRVIQIMTGMAGVLALLMFVYGSFLLMISRGDSDQVDKGKKAMVWSVAGLVVMFTAYAVLRLLFKGIGV